VAPAGMLSPTRAYPFTHTTCRKVWTAFLATAILYGGVGKVLLVPAAVAYLLGPGLGRAMVQTRQAAQVERTIDAEARRTSRSPRTLECQSTLAVTCGWPCPAEAINGARFPLQRAGVSTPTYFASGIRLRMN
jgi:hypothetical protein